MPQTASTRNPDQRSPLVTHERQTFLIGEEIYLRPPAPADADLVQSWTFTRFPVSPDRVRARIDDGERGDDSGNGASQLLIVRKADERPVGSLRVATDAFPHGHVDVAMDPLPGEHGDRWKAEALTLVMPHVTEELHVPAVETVLRESEQASIAALERIGARPCLRVPELYSHHGARQDAVMYELLDPGWVERLGDPAAVEMPRSGMGTPRPVVAPIQPETDPPANAVRVGPRVYIRPVQESDARTNVYWRLREQDTSWSNGRFAEMPGAWWKEQKELQDATPPSWVRFTVCLRENDTPIGFVGVEDIDYQSRMGESESELIDPAFRGNGYGSEAKHLLFDYAFNTLDLHVLTSWVFFPNTRSAAALRKQGYSEAGRVHWVTQRDGTFANMGVFYLQADDWRAMPRATEGAAT